MGNEGLRTAIKRTEEALQDEDAYDSFMTCRIEEMHQENIAEEIEKKGIEKGKIEIATGLKNKGISIEDIAEITKLTPELIKKL